MLTNGVLHTWRQKWIAVQICPYSRVFKPVYYTFKKRVFFWVSWYSTTCCKYGDSKDRYSLDRGQPSGLDNRTRGSRSVGKKRAGISRALNLTETCITLLPLKSRGLFLLLLPSSIWVGWHAGLIVQGISLLNRIAQWWFYGRNLPRSGPFCTIVIIIKLCVIIIMIIYYDYFVCMFMLWCGYYGILGLTFLGHFFFWVDMYLLKSHIHNRKSCNVHATTHQPQPHMIIT